MGTDCELPSGIARLDALRRRAADQGLPLHGTLELTQRCNFRCVHCYVLPGAKPPSTELSAGDWLALAQEAADAGCFSVLLTGGEPLLRNDFTEIYLGIRRMGIHVMLFTNASRVDEQIIETLRQAPPRLIEVTVYGASPETYRRVTGRSEGHAEAMRGISLLREAGLPVRLKTVLMQPNADDFGVMRRLAAEGELPMRYDAVLQPRFRGDKEIERLRLPPEEVVALESRVIPELPGQWRAQRNRRKAFVPEERPMLYSCAAGVLSFYVTADGRVQPCVSAARHGVRYERGKLLEAFRSARHSARSQVAPAAYACATCGDRVFCGSCPPLADLECGDEVGVCAYACTLAHERGKRMATEK